VKAFNASNRADFFARNPDVTPAYCDDKYAAFRAYKAAGARVLDAATGGDPEAQRVATQERDRLLADYEAMDQSCPVNFALATGNVGVMAATNEVVKDKETEVVLYVYVVILVLLWLSFRDWRAILCIVLPLAIVSQLGYGVMATLDIGMKVATLPVLALAVGIGVDYGVYVYGVLASGLKEGKPVREAYFETLRGTGKAVIFTGATLGISVLTWLWSELQFQIDMGMLLLFMFTANMLGAILLLPALASFVHRPKTGANAS
jgi:uncharacterized protein